MTKRPEHGRNTPGTPRAEVREQLRNEATAVYRAMSDMKLSNELIALAQSPHRLTAPQRWALLREAALRLIRDQENT